LLLLAGGFYYYHSSIQAKEIKKELAFISNAQNTFNSSKTLEQRLASYQNLKGRYDYYKTSSKANKAVLTKYQEILAKDKSFFTTKLEQQIQNNTLSANKASSLSKNKLAKIKDNLNQAKDYLDKIKVVYSKQDFKEKQATIDKLLVTYEHPVKKKKAKKTKKAKQTSEASSSSITYSSSTADTSSSSEIDSTNDGTTSQTTTTQGSTYANNYTGANNYGANTYGANTYGANTTTRNNSDGGSNTDTRNNEGTGSSNGNGSGFATEPTTPPDPSAINSSTDDSE